MWIDADSLCILKIRKYIKNNISQTCRFIISNVEKQIMVFVLLFNISPNSVRSCGVKRGVSGAAFTHRLDRPRASKFKGPPDKVYI